MRPPTVSTSAAGAAKRTGSIEKSYTKNCVGTTGTSGTSGTTGPRNLILVIFLSKRRWPASAHSWDLTYLSYPMYLTYRHGSGVLARRVLGPCIIPPVRRSLLTLLGLVVGAALLVWQVGQVGLDRISSGLGSIVWGFLAILLLSLLRFVVRSLAWTTLI